MNRPKRDSRFDIIYKFYQGFRAEIQTLENVKDNLEMLEYFIFESEMEKFSAKYPEVDMINFKSFLEEVDGFKVAGKKSSGENGRTTRLNTAEKAESVGVAQADFPRYRELIETVFAATKELNKLCTTGRVSFAIPKLKPKESMQEDQAVHGGG